MRAPADCSRPSGIVIFASMGQRWQVLLDKHARPTQYRRARAPMASPSPVPHATDTAEIGRTGVRVSRLGLGGVGLPGAPPATDPPRPPPDDQRVARLRRSP